MRHRFSAPQAGRLDKLIADNTPLSRRRVRTLISGGGAWVDGRRAARESQRVEAGAVVEVRQVISGDQPSLTVRYEEDGLLVIDKPAGLPTQATRQDDPNLYAILCQDRPYVGLHHRLDTPASGLLLLTLSRDLNRPISEAFQQGDLRREYLVVVLGDPGASGLWSAPLEGQRARTRFTRLAKGAGMSVLLAQLETGRTHQIRRHSADAGHPVIGDRRYGGAAGRLWARLALHAWHLHFRHPVQERVVQVTAPPPADLTPLLAQVGWSDA